MDRVCDDCFDAAVRDGRWRPGKSIDRLPERDLPPGVIRPIPVEFRLKDSGAATVACTSLPRAEMLRRLNEARASVAPWMILSGPAPCDERPGTHQHYRVAGS